MLKELLTTVEREHLLSKPNDLFFAVRNHDTYYSYSDSSAVYNNGAKRQRELSELIASSDFSKEEKHALQCGITMGEENFKVFKEVFAKDFEWVEKEMAMQGSYNTRYSLITSLMRDVEEDEHISQNHKFMADSTRYIQLSHAINLAEYLIENYEELSSNKRSDSSRFVYTPAFVGRVIDYTSKVCLNEKQHAMYRHICSHFSQEDFAILQRSNYRVGTECGYIFRIPDEHDGNNPIVCFEKTGFTVFKQMKDRVVTGKLTADRVEKAITTLSQLMAS